MSDPTNEILRLPLNKRPIQVCLVVRHLRAMRVATIFTLDQMDLDVIFQLINSTLSIKLYTLHSRILRVFIQPPANFRQSFAYFSAILYKPFSPKSRFFLIQRNFCPYYAGTSKVPPQVLATWAKTLRGNIYTRQARRNMLTIKIKCITK